MDDDDPWIDLPFCFSGSLVIDCEDSLIGEYAHTWSGDELMNGWPTPGSVQDFTVRSDPYAGPAYCGDHDVPDYDFHFKITRMLDKEIAMVNAIE